MITAPPPLSPGSRTLAPVPCFGTQTAAADGGESQGALWLRVEGPAAERLCGCEDLPHPGLSSFLFKTSLASVHVRMRLSPSCRLGQAVLAERVRDLQSERHEAREHPPLHRRGEEEQQLGPGAVAHHHLPRQGESSN